MKHGTPAIVRLSAIGLYGKISPLRSGSVFGKGSCQFVRLLKFKFGSPHRHPIVVFRNPQQLELRFPVMGLRNFDAGLCSGSTKPKAFSARSITCFGSRSPVEVTLTIAFAIRSLIGSSRSVTRTSPASDRAATAARRDSH